MGVVNLQAEREARESHMSGSAKCLACGHAWAAVAPVGAVWLECPACTLERGRLIAQCERPEPHWHCHCENNLFHLTADGIYCPNCGEWQNGF